MSFVTDVLLMTTPGVLADSPETLAKVNRVFAPMRGLVLVDPDSTGGNKLMQADIAAGGFTGLVVPDFVAHCRSIVWPDDTDRVQLAIQTEDDAGLALIEIYARPGADPPFNPSVIR